MSRLFHRGLVGFLFLLAALPALSQYQGSRIIQGEVKFPNEKAAGIGIYVALESDASGGMITTQTDSLGKFTFNALVAVRYRIRVRSVGYEEQTQEVDLSTTPFAYLRFNLKPVAGSAPIAPSSEVVVVLPNDMSADAKKEFNSGVDAFRAGKFDQSILHFQKSSELYPKYAPTLYYLGCAYATTGKIELAETTLLKSIALNDKAPEAYLALGSSQFQQHKFQDAEQTLNKAVQLSPEAFEPHYQLARTLFATQKTLDAHQHLRSALKANPRSAQAHILMGNIMIRLHNVVAALKEYREGVRLEPKGPMAEPARQMIAKLEAAQKTSDIPSPN